MKDKLTKRNLRSFDYRIRRLGAISTFMMLASAAVIVPVYQNIVRENQMMIAEIAEISQRKTAEEKIKLNDHIIFNNHRCF